MLDRVAGEREQVLTERRVAERFEHHVRKLAAQPARPPVETTRATVYGTASAVAATRRDDAADRGRQRVRELFAGTIHPHNVSGVSESEPLAVMICEEFGPEVAAALSLDAGSRFIPAAREAVVSAATERQ